jgi:hypothetical protein
LERRQFFPRQEEHQAEMGSANKPIFFFPKISPGDLVPEFFH